MVDLLIELLRNPLVILAIGIVTVVGMIIVLRVNAFIALITAALLVSLLSAGGLAEKMERVASSFGGFVGRIGIVIAMAAVIGKPTASCARSCACWANAGPRKPSAGPVSCWPCRCSSILSSI